MTQASTVPANWPTDIPAPKDSTIIGNGTAKPRGGKSQENAVAVVYSLTGTASDVLSAQKTQYKNAGWIFDFGSDPTTYTKGTMSTMEQVEQAYAHPGCEHRCAAVGDERQGHTRDRHDAEVHPNVFEGLKA